jgi:hypothetical protein
MLMNPLVARRKPPCSALPEKLAAASPVLTALMVIGTDAMLMPG